MGPATSGKIMSPASMAGLIRGISTTCGCMRPTRAGRQAFLRFPGSVRLQTGRYLDLRATDGRAYRLSSGGVGAFQVVKTA